MARMRMSGMRKTSAGGTDAAPAIPKAHASGQNPASRDRPGRLSCNTRTRNDPMTRPGTRLAGVLTFATLISTAGASALAADPKVLNVYNWSDYIAEDTIKNFEKETGIKVNYDNYDTNEVLQAKLIAG